MPSVVESLTNAALIITITALLIANRLSELITFVFTKPKSAIVKLLDRTVLRAISLEIVIAFMSSVLCYC